MAHLRVHTDRIEVHLTPAEKSLALRADDIVVQRDDIKSATITDDPWIWIRGIRVRGSAIPLVVAVGVWKYHGGSDFVIAKGKRPAVVIELAAGEFTRLIVSTNHAGALIDRLKLNSPPPAAPDGDAETEAD
ncbi:hypothetical protein [Agromyces albus]|uniref:Uncharacterized protein n=1 Tax=Agromyces albus TaxID=205332 RepID=A0A4Q2L6B8_9MICO|nr:hypothetical protein [Agromyces albus]RXZ73269.1 hypothetical protein ESP51_00770 [Agromyces albus]